MHVIHIAVMYPDGRALPYISPLTLGRNTLIHVLKQKYDVVTLKTTEYLLQKSAFKISREQPIKKLPA
jgi:hypothetical protein